MPNLHVFWVSYKTNAVSIGCTHRGPSSDFDRLLPLLKSAFPHDDLIGSLALRRSYCRLASQTKSQTASKVIAIAHVSDAIFQTLYLMTEGEAAIRSAEGQKNRSNRRAETRTLAMEVIDRKSDEGPPMRTPNTDQVCLGTYPEDM